MADISLHKPSHGIAHFAPGLLLTAVIALATAWLANLPSVAQLGLGALTLAIIGGIILGNTLYPTVHGQCDAGVQFAKQKLLRLGIILYGFRLTFQQVLDVGVSGVVIDVLMLTSTFTLACWLGRKILKLDRETAWLIGAGSSICGAAAVLATEPVIKAESSKVAVAVATVVIFGTLAIFLYPLIWHSVSPWLPGLSLSEFGIYTGSTMHEVAQVVAAGHAISPETENAAVIAKMLRVMMLAPFLVVIGVMVRRSSPATGGEKQRITFPWFALAFILVALFNSAHLIPAPAIAVINQLDNVLLAMAMAALGLTTHMSQLKRAGFRPLLLGLMLFIWLIVGGGAINLAVHHWLG
ncbi:MULTISPECIES: YeiH family putative sulfate export transporter [unclassified Pantoea]|uniref:YeiH family putative sulfate export transporter n=1 Tax=unclassified Pantoea TaxID=2630326 RepID=UPI001CD2E456|nr:MULTISPECIES: YeiH family putative sulfate export transporter [unclassified Pantoea]MCA1175227.1 YeiH family putative sulfate export transporter [Pantoea sp. alder69]MCA1250189.1 YeiH family putative sulfate export transporter [Pantoea sp. alder70]MCA1263856.1 YeiH family putative sulfate export transporter [Pantoea sp. alder81]